MKRIISVVLMAAMIALAACGCAGESAMQLARGSWDGNHYHNAFAGFDIELPEGWVSSSDEEIAAMMGQTIEMMDNAEEYEEQAAKLETIYEAMIQDPTTGNNVIVIYMNVGLMGMVGVETDEYLQGTVDELLASEDVGYTLVETTDQQLGDVTYRCASLNADYSGFAVQQHYLMCKRGSFVVSVILTAMDGTSIEDMLGLFSSAK